MLQIMDEHSVILSFPIILFSFIHVKSKVNTQREEKSKIRQIFLSIFLFASRPLRNVIELHPKRDTGKAHRQMFRLIQGIG